MVPVIEIESQFEGKCVCKFDAISMKLDEVKCSILGKREHEYVEIYEKRHIGLR